MVKKWTEDGGGGEKREKQARMVAEFQRGGYHNSTVPVKEYLEVIEEKGDPFPTRPESSIRQGWNLAIASPRDK